MSETTTRHHFTYCAVHQPLVDGKLRDCTCGAATPSPDHGQAREDAARFVSVNGMVPPPNIDAVGNLSRAYLALDAQVEQQAQMNADLVNLRATPRGDAAGGERELRQTLEDVIGCCRAAERDALRWLRILHHGALTLSEDGDLVLAMSWGLPEDAPLTEDEREIVNGNKAAPEGIFSNVLRGDVLNRVMDAMRGPDAIGNPPAPPCIHERALLATPAAPHAEAREPEAWIVVEDTDRRIGSFLHRVEAERCASASHAMNPVHEYAVLPLYTRAPVASAPHGVTEVTLVDSIRAEVVGMRRNPRQSLLARRTGAEGYDVALRDVLVRLDARRAGEGRCLR